MELCVQCRSAPWDRRSRGENVGLRVYISVYFVATCNALKDRLAVLSGCVFALLTGLRIAVLGIGR